MSKSKTAIASDKVIRNFTYELHDNENVFTSKMTFFLQELNKQLNALVNSNIYAENKEKLYKVLKSKGDFRTELLHLLKTVQYKDFYQKNYFDIEIFGNKAKYFRTVIEEYRRILLSRLQRQTVIDMIVNNPTISYQEVFNKLCELNERSQRQETTNHYEFNWISKAEFNNIIKQLENSNNKTDINNLDSVSVTTATATPINVYAIDYSSEDDQISEFSLTESGSSADDKEYYIVEFKLKYSDFTTQSDSLLTYQCRIPKKQIKGLSNGYTKLRKFTRPRIFLNKNNNKLYISFNYELISEAEFKGKGKAQVNNEQVYAKATWPFKTMGIDIGVAKSATAAIMTTNMHWQQPELCLSQGEGEAKSVVEIDFTKPIAISNELTVSEQAQSLTTHIEVLREEQKHIYKKEKAIYDLLKLDLYKNKENITNFEKFEKFQNLFNKYQKLNKLRLHLRSKVSNLKKELACITARDMISHAIDNDVDLIALEKLSWIRDEHHTTWDYNQIQQRIIHEANVYGIKVKKISCAYSSVHNPLTLEKDEVDKNRKLVKCLFDRDYAAAIILARRGIKLGKKKLYLNSHINDSFQAVNYSIKPSLLYRTLQYRQLKLCEQKSIISDLNFAYYSIL